MIRSGPVAEEDLAEALAVLNLDRSDVVEAQWVDNGPGWMGLLLASAEAVLAVNPAGKHERRIDLGLVGPCPPGSETAFELRAIFSDHLGTLIEDPVTGSLNASIAQWMVATGRAKPPYVAAQGSCLGRAGRIFIDQDDDGGIWIGGRTKSVVSGEIDL
jgi:predicted PhzF superfamily epimerase YddE/YHI9